MHRLLELSTPSAHVAVPGPVEPAIVSYYLELIGIGAGDRIVVTVDGAPTEPAPAVVTLHDLRAARVPLADEDADPAATVRVRIRDDRAVQVLSAHDRRAATAARACPPARRTSTSSTATARAPAPGSPRTARSASFAIDFALDEDGHAAAIGASTQPEEHAHATLLALRANAFRAGTVFGVDADWREAVAALRATGSAWNPLARAGVVLYGLETVEETGALSVVALGNARTESEQCYEAALTALGAVQAATTLGWAA